MKKLIILLTAMLIFALVSGMGAANEIYVNPSESIQAAVNNATSGDVIIVKSGIYTENIKITKPDLVIRSESGNPEDTIVRVNSNTSVFSMAAVNTTISGFKIESAETGIYMVSCSGCTVTNNYLSDNKMGITLYGSNYNEISENRVNSNRQHGIQILYSEGNRISNNNVNSNDRGINHLYSNKSTISGNNVSNNINYGMWISHSNYNIISGNIANETDRGINLDSSSDNNVSGNIVAINNVSGFYECPACRRNLIFNNYVNNSLNANINSRDTTWNITKTRGTNVVGGSYLGGNFWAKPGGNGFSQTATDRDKDGIADAVYTGDLQNVTDYLPLVSVSNPEKPIPILPVANFSTSATGGYAPLSVQFTNLSQNAVSWRWDFENDGKIDSIDENPVYTYTTPGNYTVNFIAGNENGTDSKIQEIIVQEAQHEDRIFPFADFSANPVRGYAPLSVQFTDMSQNATSRNWDFGDGTSSTEQNPMHTYSAAGTYTANLTATNENGTSSKTTPMNVMKHGSSGGGGGGGGGSPEPARNVDVKEISRLQVTNGKPVKFDFVKNATCVVYVSFDAKKTAGKITTIAEQLKAKSTLTSNLSSGEVYRHFNLWVGNAGFATEKNIDNPVVCFKVEKSWLQDKKIDQNSIILNRYGDKKWSELPVKLLKEDNKYLYFTAETPGFTHFAITGKPAEKEAGVEMKPETSISELDQNTRASEIEQEQKPEQGNLTGSRKSEKGSLTSVPEFKTLYAIICLFIAYASKKR